MATTTVRVWANWRDQIQRETPGGRIQTRRRFVPDQQRRIGQQRGGDPQPRPHAGGKRADLLVGGTQQPHCSQQRCQARLANWRWNAAELAPANRGIRPASDAREKTGCVGRVADRTADGRGIDATRFSQHLGPARRRTLQAQQQPQGRRLARPIGAQQPIDRTAWAPARSRSFTAITRPP